VAIVLLLFSERALVSIPLYLDSKIY